MHSLYKDELVSKHGFSRTFSSKKILTAELMAELDHWNGYKFEFIIINPNSSHWQFFVFLGNINTSLILPTCH